MIWIPQGQWNSSRGLIECVEQVDFGIIGGWLDITGEACDRVKLICAAPELLAALKVADTTLRWAAQEAGGRVKAEIVGGWLHHANQCGSAIAKATK